MGSNPPTWRFGATPQVQCALHPYPQGRRGAGRLQPSPSELRHKYNVRSIPIRKDNEVQVDCNLLLRGCATNTMCAPSPSTRTTRCRSTATFSFGATPQVQCVFHPYPQGRRSPGRLEPPLQRCISSAKTIPSSEQSPFEGKTQAYPEIKQIRINPKVPRSKPKVFEHQARRSLMVTATNQHSEANLRQV